MNEKVLLIDDDFLVLKSLASALKKEGYLVDAISDSAEVVQKVRGKEYDLIISDIRMPGMDGLELLSEVRKTQVSLKRKKIPEILITGYASDDLEKRAKQQNISAYLYKPFNLNDFLSCVRSKLKQ